MILGFALASVLWLAPAPAAVKDGETPFSASDQTFADAGACRDWLRAEAAKAQIERYDAVRGPYEIAEGDVRMHLVRAEGTGHRFWEHRCIGKELSSRSWEHSMETAEEDFTVESAARTAEWLKKDVPKQ